jgi:hypothetical protein
MSNNVMTSIGKDICLLVGSFLALPDLCQFMNITKTVYSYMSKNTMLWGINLERCIPGIMTHKLSETHPQDLLQMFKQEKRHTIAAVQFWKDIGQAHDNKYWLINIVNVVSGESTFSLSIPLKEMDHTTNVRGQLTNWESYDWQSWSQLDPSITFPTNEYNFTAVLFVPNLAYLRTFLVNADIELSYDRDDGHDESCRAYQIVEWADIRSPDGCMFDVTFNCYVSLVGNKPANHDGFCVKEITVHANSTFYNLSRRRKKTPRMCTG